MMETKTPIAVAAFSLLLATAACNGDPGGGDADTGTADVGIDTDTTDAGDTGTVDTDDPDATDTGTEVSDGGDTATDTGGMDAAETSDGGGGDADSGPGCQLDELNTDIDRDRDKLHDDCDNFKYLNHGGDNPSDARLVTENESQRPNDTFLDGARNYKLQLPVRIDGSIKPVDDDGDLDHYSFEIDEPTAILIHIEAKTDKIWPGAVFAGRENRNRNYRPQMVGAETGEDATRGVFLPVPGRYVVAISDVRNLVSDQQASDVGGNGFEYRAHLSAVPLPEAESIGVPGSTSHRHDGRLHARTVDASELTGLEVTATGVARTQDSAVNPSIALYDPDDERTLGYTIRQQIDQDRRAVSLTARLEKNYDELVVVDSYVSRFGKSSTKVDLAATDAASELETIRRPRDERGDEMTWLQPGISVDGMIGPPRTSGPTSLSPDVDYYLLSTKPGQALRVTVTPDSGGQLRPDMLMGWYIARSGGSSYFNDFGGHRAPAADQAGDSRSIEFLYNGASAGEFAFRVRHAPNNDGDSPVGGDKYSYSISVDELNPSPTQISPLPGSATGQFQPGGIGLFSFDAPQAEIVRVRSNVPDEASVDLEARLTRTSDWRQLGDTSGTIEFFASNGQTYWYDVRDEDGRGTGMHEVTVEVETAGVQEISSLPTTVDEQLAEDDEVDYYTFQGQEGKRYDVRVQAESFNERIAIYEADDYNRISRGGGGEVFRADQDGTYVVRVQSTGSSTGSYTLGVQEIQPTDIANVPGTKTGTVDDAPFPDWYKFSSKKEAAYQLSLEATGSDFPGKVAAFDARDMSRMQGGGLGTLPVRPGYAGPVYVAVYEQNQGGGSDYDYELTVREMTIASISPGQTDTGKLEGGQDRILYTFSAGKGAVDVEVTGDGAWTPKVKLVQQSDLDEVDEAEPHNGLVHHAKPESGEYAVLLRSHDSMRQGPLDYTISVDVHGLGGNTSEMEPNDSPDKAQTLSSFPAAISGSLGSGDKRDHYELSLQSGQRIWLIAIPKDRDLRYIMRPELELIDPSGSVFEREQYGGYGLFPVLENVRVEGSGTWTIRLARDQNRRNGDYALYVFTGGAFSASEQEPNDSRSNAQDLGTIDAPARIQATVDSNDPTDVYAFELKRDLDQLRVFLEEAAAGHNLRLTDNSGSEIAAAGPAHGGASNPELAPQNLDAGVYYLEVGQGNGGGKLDVVMWMEP